MLLITLARRVILDFSSCCSFELRARVITFHVCSGACFFYEERSCAAQHEEILWSCVVEVQFGSG